MQPLYVYILNIMYIISHTPCVYTDTHVWTAEFNWTLFFVNYVHTPVIVVIILSITARIQTFDVNALRSNMTNVTSCLNSIPGRVCLVW